MARTFDTLKLARALRDEAGFTGPHAEAAAVAFADAMEGDLVTKRDLDEAIAGLEAKINSLDAKIDRVAAELRAEIAKSQASMLKWVFAMVGGATALQIAASFLHH